jgi:hypothetical protein
MFYVHRLSKALASLLLTFVLVNTHCAYGEQTNRNQIRQELEKGGWSTSYGDLINEADYYLFYKAVESTLACIYASSGSATAACWGIIQLYLTNEARTQIRKIWNNLQNSGRQDLVRITEDDIFKMIIEMLSGRQPALRIPQIDIDAGLATYERWEEVIYDEPRTYSCNQSTEYPCPNFGNPFKMCEGSVPSVCTSSVRMTRTQKYPNNFQPYVRYRVRL